MSKFIDFYNEEIEQYKTSHQSIIGSEYSDPALFVSRDITKISWSSSLIADFSRQKKGSFRDNALLKSIYRPYQKQWLYFDSMFNHRVGQMPKVFPDQTHNNIVILINGKGAKNGVSALISDQIVDLNMLEAGAQCFPLYLYEASNTPTQHPQGGLFDEPSTSNSISYTRRDAITDSGLNHFLTTYPNQTITKEDLFYYIYGLLHSEDYKTKYADNLTKELPRIPCVKQAADFWAFSKAGRNLAELHINYETVMPYPVTFDVPLDTLNPEDFYVKQMKFAKKGDKTTVIYNPKITLKNIPVEAYEYVVNGKPALEWVMERQAVTTHKDSGIVNDANDWAIETMGNARYPLELFQRVITVSLETMKIVNGLPKLEV